MGWIWSIIDWIKEVEESIVQVVALLRYKQA